MSKLVWLSSTNFRAFKQRSLGAQTYTEANPAGSQRMQGLLSNLPSYKWPPSPTLPLEFPLPLAFWGVGGCISFLFKGSIDSLCAFVRNTHTFLRQLCTTHGDRTPHPFHLERAHTVPREPPVSSSASDLFQTWGSPEDFNPVRMPCETHQPFFSHVGFREKIEVLTANIAWAINIQTTEMIFRRWAPPKLPISRTSTCCLK